FLETGEKVLDLERQFEKRLKEIHDSESAVVRIGISPSRAPYMLPTLLAAYRSKNPAGKVVIEERTSAELSNRLARGELDLIISMRDEETECFSCHPLFCEHMLLAIPTDASVTNAMEAIHSLPLITVGKGQAMWKTATDIIEAFGGHTAAIECQSIESGLSLVERGLGAMVVPSYISEFGGERKKSIRFLALPPSKGQSYRREICLFYRKGQFLTRAESAFISCLDEIRSANKV
ncbi:MAG: LysR family transcriptional regulator substrate-binding protein, partial [Clostridia bacterium]|nr:LysR family transcriptional regulator substrate-binding protein [Clostridia bacterium]